jgi:hypothetical protein
MRSLRPATLRIALSLAVTACSDSVPSTKKGELGNVTFTYSCDLMPKSDPFCDMAKPGFTPGQFPNIAVGSVFELMPDTGTYPASSLDPNRVDSSGTALVAGIAPLGDVSCTGKHSTDCPSNAPFFLDDVVHVKIVDPSVFELAHPDATGAYTQILGVDNFSFSLPDDSFRAIVLDARGNMLAGGLPCLWTTSNPAVLAIQSDPAANIVHFHATGQAGHSDLHVTLGTFETTVPFDFQ